MKKKVKEILKNLNETLNKLGDREQVQSQSTVYQSTKATKKMLNKKINELKEKYK